MIGRLGHTDSRLGTLALGEIDNTSPWTPGDPQGWGITERVVMIDTAERTVLPNARVSQLTLEVVVTYAFEVAGLELLYREPLPQVAGLELLYREPSPVLAGIELLIDPNDIGGPLSNCLLWMQAVDLVTGLPIADAAVVLPDGQRSVTDASGIALLVDPPFGEQHWFIEKAGYTPTWGCTTWSDCDDSEPRITKVVPLEFVTADSGFCRAIAPTGDADLTFPAPLLFDLVADVDGIPPATCCSTLDDTPTVYWDPGALTGQVYLWELRRASDPEVILHRGTLFGRSSVQLPTLTPDDYLFFLRIADSQTDCSLWHVFPFEVVRNSNQRIILIEATEEEAPAPIELVRYLPRWMKVYGDSEGAEPAASATYQFLRPLLDQLDDLARLRQQMVEYGALFQVSPGQPRLAWHLMTRFRAAEPLTVTVKLPTDPVELRDVRRAESEHDFLTAQEPIFLIGQNGHMAFRNLTYREAMLAPATFGETENVYQLPGETVGIVHDTDMFIQYLGEGWRVPAGTVGVEDLYSFLLAAPFTGETLPWRWQSQSFVDSVQVSINGEPYALPARADLWNRFDEFGVYASLKRRPDESNVHLRRRIHSRFIAPLGTAQRSVTRQIAQDLALTEVRQWDGRTSLDLAAERLFGVRQLDVLGLPDTETRSEELIPLGDGVFSAAKTDWLPGWQLTVDGLPVSRHLYPDLTVTANQVDFGAPVSGRVHARYRFRHYTLTRDTEGSITTLTPVLANVPDGVYDLLVSRGVSLRTAADADVLTTYLLNADGTPSGTFRDLRLRLVEGSPVHLGRAAWGRDAHWFQAEEQQSQVAYLPAVFDLDATD